MDPIFEKYQDYARHLGTTSKLFPRSEREDAVQTAYLGLLDAIAKHGLEITPLQVWTGVTDALHKAFKNELKNQPRETCEVCGSAAIKQCEHKKQQRKSGRPKPEYIFGKTQNQIIPLDAEVSTEDGDTISIEDVVADGRAFANFETSSDFAEEKLEKTRQLAKSALKKVPERYRRVLYLRSQLDGEPATWEEVAAQLDITAKTARKRYREANRWLKQIAESPRPRFSNGKQRRLCSMYPYYRAGQRLPWSQDPKFNLGIIKYYRPISDAYAEVIAAEREELYSKE